MILQPETRLVCIGDSITDCGRLYSPDNAAAREALGDGYVNLVDAALKTKYPDYSIEVLNRGISGNTVRDLKTRWQRDVLDLKPDWLSIFIGINDVWRQFDSFGLQKTITLEEYKLTLEDLIRQVEGTLKGLILITPYYLEPDVTEPMRARMDAYGKAVLELAQLHNAVLVNTQEVFNTVLRFLGSVELSADRVHMNTAGHMMLAAAFLEAVQFDWNRIPE